MSMGEAHKKVISRFLERFDCCYTISAPQLVLGSRMNMRLMLFQLGIREVALSCFKLEQEAFHNGLWLL
jgi:hypothetical protein